MKLTLIWIGVVSRFIQNITSKKSRLNTDLDKLAMQMQSVLCKLDRLEHSINTLIAKGVTEDPVRRTPVASDCADIKNSSVSTSGIYTIKLSDGQNKSVYCDMDTDNGGWLVFQRRQDGSVNFDRTWSDYETGLGSLDGEFWLGNRALADITNQRSYTLRVDMEDYNGTKGHAIYAEFSVNASDVYRLSLGEYLGTAGDLLSYYANQKFSTFDRDHSNQCADLEAGGWWYKHCYKTNLNQKYRPADYSIFGHGVNWYTFSTQWLKFTEMKIRPSN